MRVASRVKFCASIFAATAIASSASADVFEYRSDGSTVVHKAASREPHAAGSTAMSPRLSSRSGQYFALVARSAAAHQVDASLVLAVIQTESRFRPRAVSPKGAKGLMQLMPDTAARFGVSDPFDPAANIEGGVRYLKWLLDRYRGDLSRALAAYNAGEEAVDRYGGVPPFPETHDYLKRIGKTIGRQLTRPSPILLVAEPKEPNGASANGKRPATLSEGLAYDSRRIRQSTSEAIDPHHSSGLVYDAGRAQADPEVQAGPNANQPESSTLISP